MPRRPSSRLGCTGSRITALIDHYRANGHLALVSADDEAHRTRSRRSLGPAATSRRRTLENRELGERLRSAVAALPPAQREALLLQQEGGLSLAEIAELTGVGAETVKSRLRYALAKLREDLVDLDDAMRQGLG